MAAFFEFEKEKNIILLLDEPGLSLHARAQMDLLDSIDNNLTKGRQVIYTTHSPFMVRTAALDRVRIVEDKGPELGSTVTNDAGSTSDPDTLFPLQAALGYDIAQSLFIGNRNIVLEGTSDFGYLEAATRANTRRSYDAALRHFEVAWGGFLPATADSVARYLADHAESLSLNTLEQRLAALARWHTDQGF